MNNALEKEIQLSVRCSEHVPTRASNVNEAQNTCFSKARIICFAHQQ